MVAFNSRFIAMHGDDWRRKKFTELTGIGIKKRVSTAWMKHHKNPLFMLRFAVWSRLPTAASKPFWMRKLHIYEENVPHDVAENITGQIRQILPVAPKFCEVPRESRECVPLLFKWPSDEFFIK